MQVPPQPQPQLSCIQALRRLFLVLSDSQFESECEIERQRRRQCHCQQKQQQTPLVENNKDENGSATDTWNGSHVAAAAAQATAAANTTANTAITTTANASTTTTANAATTTTVASPPHQWKQQNTPCKNDLNWEHRYRQLELFKAQYHHFNVPTPTRDKGLKALHTWVHTQREAWTKSLLLLKKEGGQGVDTHQLLANTRGCLRQDRIDRLIQLGMGTKEHGPANVLKDVHAASFEHHFQLLVEYQKEFGHTNVSSSHDKQHPHFRLNKWVQRQRKNYQNKCHKAATGKKMNRKNGLMSDAQFDRLSSIGFSFVAPKSLAIDKNRNELEQRMAHLASQTNNNNDIDNSATATKIAIGQHSQEEEEEGEKSQEVETAWIAPTNDDEDEEEDYNNRANGNKARTRNDASTAATAAYCKKACPKNIPRHALQVLAEEATAVTVAVAQQNFATAQPNRTAANNHQGYNQKHAPQQPQQQQQQQQQATLIHAHQNAKDDRINKGNETSRSNSSKKRAAPVATYADSDTTGPTRNSKKQKQAALLTRDALPADYYDWDVELPPASPPTDETPAPTRISQNDNDEDDDGHDGDGKDDSTPNVNRRRDYRIKWEEQMRELEAYRATFNNIKVPKGKPEFKTIYNWIRKQRVQWRKFVNGDKSLLDQRAVDRLIAVGLGTSQGPYTCKPPPVSWDTRFEQLLEYKK